MAAPSRDHERPLSAWSTGGGAGRGGLPVASIVARRAAGWVAGHRPGAGWVTVALPEFEKRNPGITVKVEPIGGDYWDAVNVQFAGGTQQFRPGDRIVELRLAREMGVSQTVVREALRELEQMGLVESFPNRGTYVRRVTRADAREIYSMRAALESFAVRLARRHQPVLEALRAGEVAAAQQAIERHILELADQIIPRIGDS